MKVLRFLDRVVPGSLVALELPGLPPPRHAGVLLGDDDHGGGSRVAVEVRRGPVPEEAPFVMMSVSRRNPALTRAEFVDRWRAEAGNLGGEAIPDDVLGLAYAQLHPLDDDAPFDAANQVWFDDLDAMRRRAEWFAARPVPSDLWDPATSFSLVLRRDRS